jgi:hypothetical protein
MDGRTRISNREINEGWPAPLRREVRALQHGGDMIEHCRHRLFEWMTTLMMLGIAVVLAVTPASIALGSFRYLELAGFTPVMLGTAFMAGGALRIVALYLNGRSRVYGPRLRAAGALLGAFVWAEMAIALVHLTPVVGTISIGVPVYCFLALGEMMSCYRAATDVRSPACR